MKKERLEAFTDAILAIIMTILVLELSVPTDPSWYGLYKMCSKFIIYAISFFVIATCWINHHHLMQLVDKVDNKVLWANTIWIFVISLFPFVTAWVGENITSFVPCFCYGMDFLLSNITYAVLQNLILKARGKDTRLFRVFGGSTKSFIAICLCILSLLLAFISPRLVLVVTFITFSLWIIPTKDYKK